MRVVGLPFFSFGFSLDCEHLVVPGLDSADELLFVVDVLHDLVVAGPGPQSHVLRSGFYPELLHDFKFEVFQQPVFLSRENFFFLVVKNFEVNCQVLLFSVFGFFFIYFQLVVYLGADVRWDV